jgi:hypothetical protein
MAKNTITLALEGEIALQEFASAISSFNSLVNQLSKEVGKDAHAQIDWFIDELYTGSAVATFRGVYPDVTVVENVIMAYEEVGDALAAGREIPFSDNVRKHAAELTSVIGDKVTSIRFETPNHDYLISGKIKGGKSESIKYTYGIVKGTIETLTMRKQLSFTLWDSLFDKPVHCYFKEGEEENMRFVWGKKAVVSGRIGRQPETGKPLVVREVKYVRVLEEVEPGSYRRARGSLPWGKGGDTPEEMIRRLRDA